MRYLKKSWSVILMLLVPALAGVLLSCAEVKVPGADKELYTAVNIWYQHRDKILSVNHHRGAILPIGTRVKIEDVWGRSIFFSDQQGARYRLILARKYTAPGFTVQDLFKQHFTETDPMGQDGAFTKLSDMEKGLVKAGHIGEGMSKQAVVMAYGYPPSHMTPSTEADVWKYWDHKFRARLVYFKDNRVVEIKRSL